MRFVGGEYSIANASSEIYRDVWFCEPYQYSAAPRFCCCVRNTKRAMFPYSEPVLTPARKRLAINNCTPGSRRRSTRLNFAAVPQLSQDGKELYYFDGTQSISAVPVKDLGNTLELGASQTFVSQWTILTRPFYSASPDGKKPLMERVS